MDFLINYREPVARRFPSPFPISIVGAVPQKWTWVHHAFSTCNFSLILEGTGEYHRQGKVWQVKAPCVITQWPGEPLIYGPTGGASWNELFFIYPGTLFRRFIKAGLINPELPVWPMGNPEGVRERLGQLATLVELAQPEIVVDRVDRLCEQVIMETWLPPLQDDGGDVAARMAEAAALIRRDFRQRIDFEAMATRMGMSLPTFRRHWAKLRMTMTPGRFQQMLRLQEASRLLVETELPVREVAHRVGYGDEFYFSRCFRREMNFAPRDYRKTFRHLAATDRPALTSEPHG